jgi:hypothetical protein
MPSTKDKIIDWIDEIPDEKLDGAYTNGRPVFTDRSCRLDCQGVTTDEPKHFNLQVQVNNQCPDTTMRKLKLRTVAFCLAPIVEPWTPEQIKDELKKTVTGWEVKPPKVNMQPLEEEAPKVMHKHNPNKSRRR